MEIKLKKTYNTGITNYDTLDITRYPANDSTALVFVNSTDDDVEMATIALPLYSTDNVIIDVSYLDRDELDYLVDVLRENNVIDNFIDYGRSGYGKYPIYQLNKELIGKF